MSEIEVFDYRAREPNGETWLVLAPDHETAIQELIAENSWNSKAFSNRSTSWPNNSTPPSDSSVGGNPPASPTPRP